MGFNRRRKHNLEVNVRFSQSKYQFFQIFCIFTRKKESRLEVISKKIQSIVEIDVGFSPISEISK